MDRDELTPFRVATVLLEYSRLLGMSRSSSADRGVAEKAFITCHMDGCIGHLFMSPMVIFRGSWKDGIL